MRTTLLALFCLALAACEPADRRPGTWLSGTDSPAPADWSVLSEHPEVWLQTSTWYGIPHSVTVVAAPSGDSVFVPSIFDDPSAEFPAKFWNDNIVRDPDVLLKVGDLLYPLHASEAIGEQRTRGLTALAGKYDFWQQVADDPARVPAFAIIELRPRSDAN